MKKIEVNLIARYSLIVPIIVVLLFFSSGPIFKSGLLFFAVWLLSPVGFLGGLILALWVLFSNGKNNEEFNKKALMGVVINLSLLILSLVSLKDFGPPA